MPIYEYICTSCNHEFEKLVRGGNTPVCPSCGEGHVERKFSLPNVKSESTRALSMRAAKQRDRTQATDRVEAQKAYEKGHDD